MVKERHHLKAHLTDESMWGSEFGGASRRSVGSRMSNQSFDKYDWFSLKTPQAQNIFYRMSGHYSNQSESRCSHRRPPGNEAPPSINRCYVKSGINPYMQQQQMTRPLANSQVVPDCIIGFRDYLRGG